MKSSHAQVLAKAVEEMRQTVSGRAMTAFRLACRLGRLVSEGLEPEEAGRALIAAAVEAGLSSREASAHVGRGLRTGAQDKTVQIEGGPFVPGQRLAPTYPPLAEVADLWKRAQPVTGDFLSCDWLRGRGLDPWTVELFDLLRVIPEGPLPSWAGIRVSWRETGHRLLVRLFDATGAVRSMRARAVMSDTTPKELAPTGFSTAGLVMADLQAAAVLRGEIPSGWRPRFVVVEGVPDWATWASRYSDADEQAPGVFGLFSGSWTPEIAERIPAGSDVVVRIHEDAAGEKYEGQVIDSLIDRCKLFRAKRGSE